jgi:ribosomal protein L11 methyltransferase
MSWLELKLHCGKHNAESLEALLWESGAVSVTLTDAEDEPLFEPKPGETPLWQAMVLTGLYTGGTDAAALTQQLQASWKWGPLPQLHFSELPEQDWVRAWLDDFKPMRFGQRLWVCPSWWLQQPAEGDSAADSGNAADANAAWTPDPADAQAWSDKHQDLLQAMQQEGQIVMQLDPGLAFGTGTHPTTSLCLQWLDARDLHGSRLVDFGCGSGILGIAALLLGAREVLGVDNDPQALTATIDNCHKNQLDPASFPLYLPPAFARLQAAEDFVPVDGIMANILAGTLIELASQLAALLRPSGWILLSGILREQSDAVASAFSPWFQDFDIVSEGDWVRISALRKAP